MSDHDTELLERYSSSGIVVDANLLHLLVVGSHDPEHISRFKRTRIFTQEDFLALTLVLEPFKKIITTPNILTEVNSFLNQLANDFKPAFYTAFANKISTLEEIHLTSSEIARKDEFVLFGLTDAGIFHSAEGKYLVLTTDARLAVYLQARGIGAINFNHLREYL